MNLATFVAAARPVVTFLAGILVTFGVLNTEQSSQIIAAVQQIGSLLGSFQAPISVLVTIGTAVWASYAHKNALAADPAAPAASEPPTTTTFQASVPATLCALLMVGGLAAGCQSINARIALAGDDLSQQCGLLQAAVAVAPLFAAGSTAAGAIGDARALIGSYCSSPPPVDIPTALADMARAILAVRTVSN